MKRLILKLPRLFLSKKLIKGGVLYTFGDFIGVAVSGFLLLPFYTRALTQTEFGIFSVVNSSLAILTFIVHFGIISTYSRLYFNQKDEYDKKVFTGQIVLLHFFMLSILFLLATIFESTIHKIFFTSINDNRYYFYLALVSAMSFLNALFGIYLRINEQAERFLAFQLFAVALYVAFIFIFKVWIENTLDAILLASFISTFIMWIVSIMNLKFVLLFDNLFNVAKKVFHFALPIFLGYIMYFLLNKFSILYLQYYENLENIALFSFAMQLSTVLVIFAGSVCKAIQPILFKLEKNQIIEKTKKIAFYYKIVLSVAFGGFSLLSGLIISLFAPESYSGSRDVFLLLLLSVYIYNFRSVESLLFMYFHKPRYSLYIVSFGAMFVLILSFLLVPKYGYIGSAYAMLSGSVVAYFASKIYNTKLLKMELKLKE